MSKKPAAPPEVCNILPELKQFLVPIDSVFPDPANANLHPDRNVSAISGSLNAFGQRTPLVCLEDGRIVKKGNGTLEAARRLGWTHIAAVFVQESHTSATAYAIADNQAGKLSEWDFETLAGQFKALEADGFDLSVTGFADYEIEPLMSGSFNPGTPDDGAGEEYGHKDRLIIEGDDLVRVLNAVARFNTAKGTELTPVDALLRMVGEWETACV